MEIFNKGNYQLMCRTKNRYLWQCGYPTRKTIKLHNYDLDYLTLTGLIPWQSFFHSHMHLTNWPCYNGTQKWSSSPTQKPANLKGNTNVNKFLFMLFVVLKIYIFPPPHSIIPFMTNYKWWKVLQCCDKLTVMYLDIPFQFAFFINEDCIYILGHLLLSIISGTGAAICTAVLVVQWNGRW
jgi:hypothetical protein